MKAYETDVNYELSQSLKKTTHIYVVKSVAKTSFNPMGYQGSAIPTFSPIPTGRPAEPLLH